ncbi:hypothetical protein OG612_10115 [Streptomyces sp. NBC_01527]|uniref:hypothetical protein n=1 Tax=unclassified Streptomyces TaxID=2593676 RepID=UPI002E10F088|nr:hypothetical protein OG763_33505 [Streptomyces sp. NBC_01230]
MSKRATVQHQPAEKDEAQPSMEFRVRGFHVTLDKVPWKFVSALAGAAVTVLAGGHPWML